jgi:hypothetical protein
VPAPKALELTRLSKNAINTLLRRDRCEIEKAGKNSESDFIVEAIVEWE